MSRRLSITLISAGVVLMTTPANAQDFLGGLLRSTAENAATQIVNRAVTNVTSPRAPAPSATTAPAAPEEVRQPAPASGRPQVNYQGTPAQQQAFRLSNMQARGLPPPTGWYVLKPELTREQNCQAMKAANQWTEARSENPCRPQ